MKTKVNLKIYDFTDWEINKLLNMTHIDQCAHFFIRTIL